MSFARNMNILREEMFLPSLFIVDPIRAFKLILFTWDDTHENCHCRRNLRASRSRFMWTYIQPSKLRLPSDSCPVKQHFSTFTLADQCFHGIENTQMLSRPGLLKLSQRIQFKLKHTFYVDIYFIKIYK